MNGIDYVLFLIIFIALGSTVYIWFSTKIFIKNLNARCEKLRQEIDKNKD